MSECDCGQVEIPLGLPMCNLNGTLHGVTACVDKDRWEERALEAEAAIARVRDLCAEARVGNSRGCTCYGNECSGNCGRGEPFSWTLDPQAVLRALGDSDE